MSIPLAERFEVLPNGHLEYGGRAAIAALGPVVTGPIVAWSGGDSGREHLSRLAWSERTDDAHRRAVWHGQRLRKARFDRFEASLEALSRFEVRRGELAYRGLDHLGRPRFEQKMVDILLGVDLARLAAMGRISDAVVVAGDSDFVPANRAAKDDGVLIRLVHGRFPHRAIAAIADERIRIDQALIDRIRRPTPATSEV